METRRLTPFPGKVEVQEWDDVWQSYRSTGRYTYRDEDIDEWLRENAWALK